MRYKHTTKPIDEIGRELGVGYVLEGSVRRAGQRVRITVVREGQSRELTLTVVDRPRLVSDLGD